MSITPAFLRAVDWSRTPLGPIDAWPRTLRSYVDMILELPTPAIIFWGPEQTQIYNDGYAVIMGPRHPRYFGAPYRECWPDTAPVILPWMRQVLEEGRHVQVARAPFTLTRHGFVEEAYFTFTFSPLRDDEGRIRGIYQPVVEVTDAVLRERRAEALRTLTGRDDVVAGAVRAFEAAGPDVPFAAVYLTRDGERAPALVAAAGFADLDACAAQLRPHADAIARALADNAPVEAEIAIATPSAPEPVRTLFVTPVRRSPGDPPAAVIAFGANPRVRFDATYREFFEAAAREIGGSLAAQRAARAELDWREREEAAKEAHARRLATLFEHAPVGIAVLRGADHVFEVANPRYAELLRHRPLLHLPLREALPELAGQGIFELVDRVYRSGEPYVGRSVRLVLERDGGPEERFFDFVYQPIPGEDGATESIIVVVFEVTELARARRDAEAANRAKDEFFAILGHELRNPLAPITTALHLMALRGGDTLAKERTIIQRQVAQITRLVDDLLDVSRITRGKVTLEREPTEISEVVAKAIEMASPLIEQRRHHLVVDVPADGLVLDADASRLAQVVANLLTNAAKYTEAGGRVRVAAEARGGDVVLRVSDSGVGIAPEMLPRVFEPFAQEQQSLDRAQGGLGLGLTIVASLVKLHGGTVTAESAGRGHGATFTVTLPRAEALRTKPHVAAVRAPPAPARDALRVLVVDDNHDAAEMLAEALGMLGYDTRVAYDAAEAIRADGDFAPHVALLDIGLPVMDGYELAGRLRAAPRRAPLHLVAVTGYGQESDRARARDAGFDAHVVKPVQVDALAALMARYRDAAPER